MAVQATVIGVAGLIVGLPVGITLGRWLWVLFAREIYAVPQPTVPALQLVIVVIGTIALTNFVAAIPGHMAARTPTAAILRAE